MRRLARRVLNLLMVLSLLLCVAACVLWVGSYERVYAAVYQSPRVNLVEWHSIWAVVGGSVFYEGFTQQYRVPPNSPPPSDTGFRYHPPNNLHPYGAEVFVRAYKSQGDGVLLDRVGFHLAHSVYGDSAVPELKHYRRTVVQIPLWSMAVLSAVMPLSVFFRRITNRRLAQGLFCPSCGYDLRATPARCPECGAAAPAPSRPEASAPSPSLHPVDGTR